MDIKITSGLISFLDMYLYGYNYCEHPDLQVDRKSTLKSKLQLQLPYLEDAFIQSYIFFFPENRVKIISGATGVQCPNGEITLPILRFQPATF